MPAHRRLPGWCASSSCRRRRCHASGRIMPERPRRIRWTPGVRSSGVRGGDPTRAAMRPGRHGAPGVRSARAPAGRRTGGQPVARPGRSASPRGSRAGPRPRDGRSSGCSASRPSASRAAIASSCRPAALTARCRFADSAFRTRFRSPRRARETWRASSSSSAPPAPMRRRNVPTASPLFQVTTPRPRRMRQEAGRPMSASRPARIGASSGSTTNSRCVRPPARLSEPRARNRPRSHAVRQ